ncbi:MAG: GTP 3',8-cyclase MoaA [Anaerolineales bacterium]|nr:GTP 3',8-cyclase MoaA [Anaerolineales bacterium]
MITDHFNRPLRDLRISVTDRCNFRCPYCMPEEIFGERFQFLPKAQILSFEEIIRTARVMVGLGVKKLRITGGEPLMRHSIEDLIAELVKIEGVEDIAMTTNGYLLPPKVDALKAAGLHRLTISLDSLDDAVFQRMNGRRASVEKVLEGVTAAEQAGFSPLKINCVVQRGINDHTIVDLARYFKERGHIMRFIEYMDVGTMNGWRLDDVVPAKEIVARIHAAMPLEPLDRNYRGEVALRYRYQDGDGEIGLIASVTQPFCGDCTRLRLSPEGELFTCLFATQGTDLRAVLRSGATDDELVAFLTNLWSRRVDRYSEERTENTTPRDHKVEMYHIGG